MEENLVEKERKYRALVESLPGMAYRGKPDWSIEIVGPGLRRITGYAKSEFDSGKVHWLDIVHPDDKKKVLKEASVLDKKETFIAQEYRIVRKDKKIAWVDDHKHSLHRNGVLVGVEGVVFDITEKKKTKAAMEDKEERYRKIFEMSPQAVILLNRNGKIAEVNKRFYDWLGYKPKDIIGKGRMDLPFLSDAGKAKIMNALKRRLAGEDVPPYPMEFITKDGRKEKGRVCASLMNHGDKKSTRQIVLISILSNKKPKCP
jgi:PAS domain S-box-containing protein